MSDSTPSADSALDRLVAGIKERFRNTMAPLDDIEAGYYTYLNAIEQEVKEYIKGLSEADQLSTLQALFNEAVRRNFPRPIEMDSDEGWLTWYIDAIEFILRDHIQMNEPDVMEEERRRYDAAFGDPSS